MSLRWAKRMRGIVALALLTEALSAHSQTPAPPASTSEQAAVGPAVLAIRIVRDDGKLLAESPSGISVELGKPFDRGKVAESLRALYRTGDYANVKAVVTPVTDGLRLDFVVRENLFFN